MEKKNKSTDATTTGQQGKKAIKLRKEPVRKLSLSQLNIVNGGVGGWDLYMRAN